MNLRNLLVTLVVTFQTLQMKISVISDIHDHVWNLKKVLNNSKLQETDALLCCGDLCSPFIIKLLGGAYKKPVHLVLGNNDGDLAALISVASAYSNITIHGEYFTGTFDERSIAMNHYPDKAKKIAENGGFDMVFYGHDHTLVTDKKIGDTLLLNPGAIMGYSGGALKDITPTFMIVDVTVKNIEVINL